MKAARLMLVFCLASLGFLPRATALERTNVVFKVFQFPADKIPVIDGQINDWDIVPRDYVIGTDQLVDDTGKHPKPDPNNLDVPRAGRLGQRVEPALFPLRGGR